MQADESWAMAGGLGGYDDGFGGGGQFRAKKGSHTSFGLLGAVSDSANTVRIQGRIGG